MKIALIGDLHYPQIDNTIPGLPEAREAFFQTFIENFLEMEADFHISLGDLTNYGHTSELMDVYQIIRKSPRNFYHVLGNHDLYAQPRNDVLSLTGQKRYHAIMAEQIVLVFLDTAREMDLADWGGWIDEEQLKWFEEIVKNSGTKPMFVFAHHPVYDTTKNSTNEKGSIHQSIDMWRILEQKKGLGVYFNGHTHVESISKKVNWKFVQLAACLDQHSIRLVELNPEQLQISPIDVTDEIVKENAITVYNNIKHFKHNPHARGEESDRKLVINLQNVNQLI